jgi:fumarate reductase flavoprotein subunit
MEKEKKGISRRSFLKGVAAGAAGIVAAGALAGCGQQEKPPPDSNAEKQTGYSWEVPPEPIPEKEIKKTVTSDVVVIGAGVSGLMAALAAVESNVKTVLIEKHSSFTARGGHNGAIGSKLQKKLGIEIDKAQVVRDLVRWAGTKVDERLIMLWADKSGEVMDYLIDMAEAEGMEVTMFNSGSSDKYYTEYVTAHMFGGMNEANLAGMLEKKIRQKGGDIYYKTPAVQLIRKEGGRVTGVIAGEEGNYTLFNARKAVVLCTGDYGNNKEMLERFCPKALDVDMNVYAPALNTGDGHKMGLWIGAALQEEEPHAPMIHNLGGAPMTSNPFLRVNALGERYQNEDVPVPYICNAISRQPRNIAWVVFDGKFADDAPKMGGGFAREPMVTQETLKALEKAIGNKTAVKADTIEDLAQKMGVPVESFRATVERYNQLAKMGVDLDFGKNPRMLTTIEQPPFYAAKIPTVLLVVLGGFKVNTKMQVLDTKGKIIPGLYAAGNVTGDFFANDYPVICPGLSHGRALTFGRIAGLNAAAEKV